MKYFVSVNCHHFGWSQNKWINNASSNEFLFISFLWLGTLRIKRPVFRRGIIIFCSKCQWGPSWLYKIGILYMYMDKIWAVPNILRLNDIPKKAEMLRHWKPSVYDRVSTSVPGGVRTYQWRRTFKSIENKR